MRKEDKEVVLGDLVWKGKTLHSMGDIVDAILGAKDKEEAQRLFNAYVSWGAPKGLTEQVAKSNIGYFAGYYTAEHRKKVYELLGAEHPVFGNTFSTGDEAFKAGLKAGLELAKRHKEKK